MPKSGDQYTITLKETHLDWGNHRYTATRDIIYDEGYIPIPKDKAVAFEIYNVNESRANNIYTFSTADKFFTDEQLKASGCSEAGDRYAKQFHGNENLKLLGSWFTNCSAKVGDTITVTFTGPNSLILKHN